MNRSKTDAASEAPRCGCQEADQRNYSPRLTRTKCFISPTGTMSGLPLFSRSSSNRSDGKMVAHPAGWLFRLAKRQGGVLQQENSADPSLAVTGDPKTFLVAADEKCRDRLIDDAGIERLKLSDEGRQDAGALVLPLGCSSRTSRHLSPRMIWACQPHGDHRVFIDGDEPLGGCRGRTCSASAATCRIRSLTKVSSISR